jgi:hypothetical protein
MLSSKFILRKRTLRNIKDDTSFDNYYLIRHGGEDCECPYSRNSELCGTWCPLFEIISVQYNVKSDIDAINETVDCGTRVVLHCGSGNAEYKIQEIKGE